MWGQVEAKNSFCKWQKSIQQTQVQEKMKINSKMVWEDTGFLNVSYSFPSLLTYTFPNNRPLILPISPTTYPRFKVYQESYLSHEAMSNPLTHSFYLYYLYCLFAT